MRLKKSAGLLLGACMGLSLLSGCATQPAQKPMTPEQIKQYQELGAMQARWRDEDMLEYSKVPGGYQAWKQLRYH